MQLEQLYLSFNEISARTVIDMARNLKGLIFLDVFGLKLTLLEAREIFNFVAQVLEDIVQNI
jgi:Leucine-rich repeat (LRR) protein